MDAGAEQTSLHKRNQVKPHAERCRPTPPHVCRCKHLEGCETCFPHLSFRSLLRAATQNRQHGFYMTKTTQNKKEVRSLTLQLHHHHLQSLPTSLLRVSDAAKRPQQSADDTHSNAPKALFKSGAFSIKYRYFSEKLRAAC